MKDEKSFSDSGSNKRKKMKMKTNKIITDPVEECGRRWKAVVVHVEDEDEPDPIHFEFMQDSMIGMIAGTLRTVPIIDPIATRAEAAEVVNKIGVAEVVLDVVTIIITIIMAEIIINKAMSTKTQHQINIRAITVRKIDHS